jgi:hypothetical protein
MKAELGERKSEMDAKKARALVLDVQFGKRRSFSRHDAADHD